MDGWMDGWCTVSLSAMANLEELYSAAWREL
jgi:hypothetical protein